MRDTCDSTDICEQVREVYTTLALHPEKKFGWNKGRQSARARGYDDRWLELLPAPVWESAAAVGNPFAIGSIEAGETVLDLGCGAGPDVCSAALLVGPNGLVIGIDFTPAMVEKARTNSKLAGLHNRAIHEADIADLPLSDACADVVISNGAINLSPCKPCVLEEAFRVLKPGGRLYIADMVRDGAGLQCGTESSGTSWANCVAGALSPECFLQMLSEAGFEEAAFLGTTGYRTSLETIGVTFRARKPPCTKRSATET
jgi:arsenite methyltransferase